MSNDKGAAKAAPSIASKAELDQRKAQRPKPVMAQQLTPGGGLNTEVRRQVNAQSENRISYLENRLNALKGQSQQAFSQARRGGTAKKDFDRSR